MILSDHIDHRPWPLPDAPWVMHQAWNDFLFTHIPVDPAAVRALVPEPLELQLHDGTCYLGVIPFHMTDVRPRGTVNMPGLSAFPELNVRTYVTYGGRPGVFFLSLEAHNRLAVETARLTYDLPYYAADMHWERVDRTVHYRARRTDTRGPAAVWEGRYAPEGEPFFAPTGSLERWLSERYCLFTVDARDEVWLTDVHHMPWPLRQVQVDVDTNTMAAAHGLAAVGPMHTMYSPGVDVLVWTPRRFAP